MKQKLIWKQQRNRYICSKTDMAGLKTKEDNFDAEKLEYIPAGLSNLSNVVDNDIKKTTW